jgi:cardiolipin synthase
MWTIANILTVARVLLLPPIIVCFFVEGSVGALAIYICFGLYVLAAVTDFFDGWVARKFNQITAFGTFLDPISDKIFVSALMILLVAFGRLEGLWILPVIAIMSRELLISGLREFLGGEDVKMPVTNLAKWKTTVQMVALGLLILGPLYPLMQMAGEWGLLVAAVLTLVTGWKYLQVGMEVIKKMA